MISIGYGSKRKIQGMLRPSNIYMEIFVVLAQILFNLIFFFNLGFTVAKSLKWLSY